MNFYYGIIVFFLVSINAYANGWSSSGGGLFISNQNNPWFLGIQPVKWCIDHGGKNQFSLPLEDAKKEIQTSISTLTKQIEYLNQNSTEINDSFSYWSMKKIFYRKCGIKKVINEKNKIYYSKECNSLENNKILISTSFIYTNNCKEADLEFILGNQNNPKIIELKKTLGTTDFQKIIGIAVRTEYSELDMRGKGFIFISSDIGQNQYNGPRNIGLNNKTIWNLYKFKYPVNFINKFKSNFDYNLNSSDFFQNTISSLVAVSTHELGHVLGFQHNHLKNIMNEDYPAEVIKNGIEFKGNYSRASKIISESLNESGTVRRIAYEWNQGDRINISASRLKNESPTIYNLLYSNVEINPEESKVPSKNILFVYNSNFFNINTEGKTSIDMFDIDFKNNKLTKIKNIETLVDLTKGCDRPNIIDSVNLRHSQTINNSYETIPLISLGNSTKCGFIYPNESNANTKLAFKLSHNYYQDNSILEITDLDNPVINVKLVLRQSDILLNDSTTPLPFPKHQFFKGE